MSGKAILTAMLPEHLLLAGIVLLIILAIAGSRRGGLAVSVLVVAAAAVAAAMLHASGYSASPFAGHFSAGPVPFLAKAVVLALAVPVLLMARHDFADDSPFYPLLLSSLYGFCLLMSADSFLTLFLGLEIMSIPVYVMVLLAFQRPESVEAALKYLVLGGTATALFLMGVSLLYGGTGSLAISAFTGALGSSDPMAIAAVVLVLVAFFLKAAIVPFHAWAPDAYEGASLSVTAFMATIIKAGVVLAALRLFATAPVSPLTVDLLALLPLVSIVWGNLTAMRQTSFRRMIAYSSIAHAGYLFYAFLGAGPGRFQAVVL
jgi:NADH-quinone oxidoreductase subunit N